MICASLAATRAMQQGLAPWRTSISVPCDDGGSCVSNMMAIILGSLIVLAVIADQMFNAGAATMFLLRKMFILVEHLAFWT
jgi:hypothetical protein